MQNSLEPSATSFHLTARVLNWQQTVQLLPTMKELLTYHATWRWRVTLGCATKSYRDINAIEEGEAENGQINSNSKKK